MKAAAESSHDDNPEMMPTGQWPGPFGAYKYSQKVVSFNLGAFLPLILFTYVADIAAAYSADILVKVLFYIVVYLLELSSFVVLISSFRGKKIPISEALDRGTRLSLKILAVYILVGLAVVLSFIALIIPGLIITPRLVFAPFYVLDKDMGVREAIEASWKNSSGYGLKTWGVLLVQLLFAVLSLILIGIYLTIVYSAAIIVLYGYINSRSKK